MSFCNISPEHEEFLGPDATMTSVVLRAYDISHGFASLLRSLVNVEGIWHTGIEVFGVEYFYGGGIQALPANEFELINNLTVHHTVVLGVTSKLPADLEEHLQSIQHRFTEATYNILTFNCNHFSNEVSQFLLGVDIPDKYLRQAEIISRHPFGAQAIGLIQGLGLSNPVTGSQPTVGRTTPNVGGTQPSSQPEVSPVAPSTSTVRSTTPSVTDGNQAVQQSLDSAGELGSALRVVISNGTAAAQKKCLEVLEALLFTIFSRATIAKYRTIKGNNAIIRETIIAHPGGTLSLEALGFVRLPQPPPLSASSSGTTGASESPSVIFELPVPNAKQLHRLLNARKLIRQLLQSKFGSNSTNTRFSVSASELF